MQDFVHNVRVYYENTDSGGVVYHADYLKFLERTRTEWLRHLGFEQDRLTAEEGVMFVVSRMEIDFRSPARFNQLLQVSVRPETIRRASLILDQEIHEAGGGGCCCQARVKIACVDARSFKPTAIPRSITREITHAS